VVGKKESTTGSLNIERSSWQAVTVLVECSRVLNPHFFIFYDMEYVYTVRLDWIFAALGNSCPPYYAE
jgi:hypothetical protein